VDAIAPGLIGIGIYLMYEAWESHKSGQAPSPLAKLNTALTGTNNVAGTAPYTGAEGASETVQGQTVTLPQGVSVGAGGSVKG
jgi:hypothetical protein